MTPAVIAGKVYNVCNVCGKQQYEITDNMVLATYVNSEHEGVSAEDYDATKMTFERSLYDPTYGTSSTICSKCGIHKKYTLVKGVEKIEMCPQCGA